MTESIREAIGDARNVLLLSPVMNAAARDLHMQLLTMAAPERENVLAVTYRDTPDRWLRSWQESVGELPARVGVVSVGESMRSADGSSPGGDAGSVSRAVQSPTDLTGLGITVSEYLKEWSGNGNRTVACFDSVTAFLQYRELHTVYRFLHVMTNRLSAVDAVGHYHLDPDAYDEQTVSRLKSLFDASVEITSEDDWTVHRR